MANKVFRNLRNSFYRYKKYAKLIDVYSSIKLVIYDYLRHERTLKVRLGDENIFIRSRTHDLDVAKLALIEEESHYTKV